MLELSDDGFFSGSVLFDVGVALTSELQPPLRLDGFCPLLEARFGHGTLEAFRKISQPVELRLVQLAVLAGLK